MPGWIRLCCTAETRRDGWAHSGLQLSAEPPGRERHNVARWTAGLRGMTTTCRLRKGAAARLSPPPTRRSATRGHLRHRRRADPMDVPAPLGTAAPRRPAGLLRERRRPAVQLPGRHRLGRDPGPRPAPRPARRRSTTPGSPPAASPASCRSPRSTSRTTPTSPSTRASNSSTEDTRRGMSRGTNHSTQEATRDTGREQKAQVGRQKASAITTSTGLRRRERRFESCRGHHA